MTRADAPEVGQVLPTWEVPSVSAEKMKTMAGLLGDSNPIHWDAASLRALGMDERPVNQGPSNMAYMMNLLTSWAGGHDRLSRFRVRFLGNVLAGQHLQAQAVVTSVQREAAATAVECDITLTVVGGEPVMTGTATLLLPLDAPATL